MGARKDAHCTSTKHETDVAYSPQGQATGTNKKGNKKTKHIQDNKPIFKRIKTLALSGSLYTLPQSDINSK